MAAALPAGAASFSVTDITGVWTAIDGNPFYYSGIGTSGIRWGEAATSSGQSGFNFEAASDITVDSDSFFVLGQLTHLNFPIWNGTGAVGADLALAMTIDGVVQNFGYGFTIDETPNTVGACPLFQISGVPCDDRIDFTSPFSSASFTKNDSTYTLELFGFSRTIGSLSPVNSFITEELKASSAFLVGRLVVDPNTVVVVDPPDLGPQEVPEPIAPVALALVGLGGLGLKRRRDR
ncbi:MAG: hypothetical protein Fur0042_12040 [Cyanophyceae cyanobacterium]